MTKDEILDFLSSQKKYMMENFGVIKIGLFGSYARSENSENSDIDIVVELKRENKADNYFNLLHFLEDNLHKKIDLGIESSIKEVVKESIKKEIIHV